MANEPYRPVVPQGGTEPLSAAPAPNEFGKQEIVNVLNGYKQEAKNAREGGMNPRDSKWRENLDLYWNRVDFSKKANWQARETMPEVPSYVDRFAAALKEALIANPEGFYTVKDPADKENDVGQAIKRMTDVWLTTAGRNQVGQLLPFSSVFEEQMKLGALMATNTVTLWKEDVDGGRVAVESVDPMNTYLDPTYRNLYRLRQQEIDFHELRGMINSKDSNGSHIFDVEEIAKLSAGAADDIRRAREEMSGTGQQQSSTRKPITLDEYIATVVDNQGNVIADRGLFVVANGNYLLRGPEKNPFWHEKDWMSYAPLITAPLSPYGRSYMEDFGSVAKTFTELTNMILDAVHTSALKAYAMVPGMLVNPQQAAEGISPNKVFLLEDGYRAEDFAKALDLGSLSSDAVAVWEKMKAELSEAARINEIGLGQFAPNSRTSATEISETQQSSSALIRSVAQTVETRFLDPQLDLVWKTGLQHVHRDNEMLRAAAGDKMFDALLMERKKVIKRPITFQARGISTLIARSSMLKSLVNILGIVAQNEILLNEFLQKIDPGKLVDRLLLLSGVDVSTLQMSEREKLIRGITEPMNAAGERVAGAPAASPGGAQQISDVTRTLGIGR